MNQKDAEQLKTSLSKKDIINFYKLIAITFAIPIDYILPKKLMEDTDD
jgi:hypothetical protein